ncbi:MAG: N-acetylneuraminate synthase family protein [Candidatus Hodarchaeales archaeon]|jgi:N-acetylneuraminate synthase
MVTNNKPLMVAELSINHLGMLNIAKIMIDEAISGGANLIKLKFKNVDKYYKDDAKKWRNFNFKSYRNSLELSKEDFSELAEYCNDKGVQWFCTVHDEEGLEFIRKFDPPFYKVASMDADKHELVEKVIELCRKENKPLVISLGGKTDAFVSRIVERINSNNIKAYLLHTVSIYPTPTGKSNINYITHLRKRFESDNIKIGYSGHEIGYAPTILAVMQGAEMIERHFSLSTDWNIHHIKCALTPEQYREMNSIIDELVAENNTGITEFHKEELTFLKKMDYQ